MAKDGVGLHGFDINRIDDESRRSVRGHIIRNRDGAVSIRSCDLVFTGGSEGELDFPGGIRRGGSVGRRDGNAGA